MQMRALAIFGAVAMLSACEVGERSLRTDYDGVYAEARFDGDSITSELRSVADDQLLASLRVSGDSVTWSNATGEETPIELDAWELPDDELTANDKLYQISGPLLANEADDAVGTDSPYFNACIAQGTGLGIVYICVSGCNVMQCVFDFFINSVECFSYNVCVQDGGTWS